MEKKWFDVHFSLDGFYKIHAKDADEAAGIAEEILEAKLLNLEDMAHTGLGIEIYDVLETELNEDDVLERGYF
jgi:hypothetical protein